jgi:tetrahydromethanopterin S-methyltransferase subunit G
MKFFGRGNETVQRGNYPAALRVTAPLLPSIAVLVTILAYLVLGEDLVSGKVAKLFGVTDAVWEVMYGDFAVLSGLLIGLLIWFTVALFYYQYTSAYFVSRRNFNGLKERLDYLNIRVEEGEKNVKAAESEEPENGDLQWIRRQALALAKRECDAIGDGLESKGMPVVTGIGYIELWHRVHRAEVESREVCKSRSC